ncbi:hypothetical protein C8R32_1027 [Nitrosospira sp. Nsp5]|nr:hypothetical protein C8R32_1027 [Nitrosospira sp. Nsp5]
MPSARTNSKLTHLRRRCPAARALSVFCGEIWESSGSQVARARGNQQYHDEQADLGVEQPAVLGGDHGGVGGVDHAVGDDDAGGDDGQHDRQRHDRETFERLGAGLHRFFARLEQFVDAGNGVALEAGGGGRRMGRRGGAGETDDEESRQGAEPDAGQDDVQGVGQDRYHREFFGRGMARE